MADLYTTGDQMSLLDGLAGRKRLLSFEVAMGVQHCTCNFIDVHSSVAGPSERFAVEIIRLFACYEAFVIYGVGGPQSEKAKQALKWLSRLLQRHPDNRNVFAKLGGDCWREGYDLVPARAFSEHAVPFCGAFYSLHEHERRIDFSTPFGPDNTPLLTTSALALLECGIRLCSDCDRSEYLLRLFAQTCENLLVLYQHYDKIPANQVAPDVSRAQYIPDCAFLRAVDLQS